MLRLQYATQAQGTGVKNVAVTEFLILVGGIPEQNSYILGLRIIQNRHSLPRYESYTAQGGKALPSGLCRYAGAS